MAGQDTKEVPSISIEGKAKQSTMEVNEEDQKHDTIPIREVRMFSRLAGSA